MRVRPSTVISMRNFKGRLRSRTKVLSASSAERNRAGDALGLHGFDFVHAPAGGDVSGNDVVDVLGAKRSDRNDQEGARKEGSATAIVRPSDAAVLYANGGMGRRNAVAA